MEERCDSYQLSLQVVVLVLQFSDAHTRLCKSPLQVFTPVSGHQRQNYHDWYRASHCNYPKYNPLGTCLDSAYKYKIQKEIENVSEMEKMQLSLTFVAGSGCFSPCPGVNWPNLAFPSGRWSLTRSTPGGLLCAVRASLSGSASTWNKAKQVSGEGNNPTWLWYEKVLALLFTDRRLETKK